MRCDRQAADPHRAGDSGRPSAPRVCSGEAERKPRCAEAPRWAAHNGSPSQGPGPWPRSPSSDHARREPDRRRSGKVNDGLASLLTPAKLVVYFGFDPRVRQPGAQGDCVSLHLTTRWQSQRPRGDAGGATLRRRSATCAVGLPSPRPTLRSGVTRVRLHLAMLAPPPNSSGLTLSSVGEGGSFQRGKKCSRPLGALARANPGGWVRQMAQWSESRRARRQPLWRAAVCSHRTELAGFSPCFPPLR